MQQLFTSIDRLVSACMRHMRAARRHLRDALQHVAAAQQQASLGAHGRGDQHRGRCGQAERAGAGDD